MRLTDSPGRKAAAVVVATSGMVWFLEATIFDSQHAQSQAAARREASLVTGAPATFTATAYCTGTVTSTGVAPQHGIAAADPSVLPAGSIIDLDTGDRRMSGLYTVLDTGPNIKGRRLDLYNKSCSEAVRFGRRTVRVTVLRSGWSLERARPSGSPSTTDRRATSAPRPATSPR